MKKKLLIGVIAMSMLLCACGKKPKPAPQPQVQPEPQVVVQEEKVVDFDSYYTQYTDLVDYLIDTYNTGWSQDTVNTLGVSSIFAYGSDPNLGFIQMDINSDGIDELLLGTAGAEGDAFIYDIYTLRDDGAMVHVGAGNERDYYYLCDGGVVVEKGTSSASQSFTAFCQLIDAELYLTEAVIYDDMADPDFVWFYSVDGLTADTGYAIEESAAFDVENAYVYDPISLNYFVDYAN